MSNDRYLNTINQINNIPNSGNRLEYVKSIISLVNKNEYLSLEDKETIKEFLEEKGIEVRMCSHCNNLMITGCIIGGGYAYYCSDECLGEEILLKEQIELFEGNSDENYWTDWE